MFMLWVAPQPRAYRRGQRTLSPPMPSNATVQETYSLTLGCNMSIYQMLSQAVESEDPNVMRAKIQDFENTFEQTYRRKMTDDELSMLKTAKEIVERELWAERKKAA
jgi:hypothetical protein